MLKSDTLIDQVCQCMERRIGADIDQGLIFALTVLELFDNRPCLGFTYQSSRGVRGFGDPVNLSLLNSLNQRIYRGE